MPQRQQDNKDTVTEHSPTAQWDAVLEEHKEVLKQEPIRRVLGDDPVDGPPGIS